MNQSEEVLVVPLEVEVGAACGLYSPEDVLDFGIGGSNDPPTTLILWLHNSWKKAIKIQVKTICFWCFKDRPINLM